MVMLNMVSGGDYTIEVVDANGCSFDASVTLSSRPRLCLMQP